MNISNREEKGFGTYPDTSPSEPCEVCQKLPAYRHYNHSFVCTPCFIDLSEKDRKSQTGGKPYVQQLNLWDINQKNKIQKKSTKDVHAELLQGNNPSEAPERLWDDEKERVIGISKLHHIKPSHQDIPSSYIEGFKRYVCEWEGRINLYPKVTRVKGNPYSEEAQNYASVSRTYMKLRRFIEGVAIEGKEKGVYLCIIVLTFPKELSEHFYKNGEYERVWEVYKEFWRRLEEEECIPDGDRKIRESMGGMVNLHIWGTREPLEPHFHFHSSFLNVIKKSEEEKKGGSKFRRVSPMLGKAVLEGLKEKWRMIVEEEGKKIYGEGYGIKKAALYYSFVPIEEKRKVLHRVKYQNREWIIDFCNWSERTEYTGKIAEKMRRYNNNARTFGYWKRLTSELSEEEREEMGEELKEMKKGMKKVCPFCGELTEKQGEESPEEVWKKEKNGELEWYEFNKGGLEKARHQSELFFSYLCLPEGMCKAPKMVREYEELPTRAQRVVDEMSHDKELLARLLVMMADFE